MIKKSEKICELCSFPKLLIIRKGKIKLSVYTQNGTLIEKVLLKKGELFLLVEGGIGIDFINDSEIYEIKNGPFKKDKILI